jgi:hypothetical protein
VMVSGYRITQESQGLGRLPLASLLAARCVCRRWRDLTVAPQFLQMRREEQGTGTRSGRRGCSCSGSTATSGGTPRLPRSCTRTGGVPSAWRSGVGIGDQPREDVARGREASLPGPRARRRAPCPPSVSRGDVAFVLALPGVHVPVLYYALMAVGTVMSPANPALTAGEISGLVTLSGPSVAFAVKATAGKLPPGEGGTPPCGAGAAAQPRAGAGRPALRGAVAGALLLRVSSPGHVGRAYALRLAGRDFSANPFREAAMAEEQRSSGVRVCVTGGAGFIDSWLVKKLLERGYTVHATLRNTGARAPPFPWRLISHHFDPRKRSGSALVRACLVRRSQLDSSGGRAGDEKKAGMLRRLVPGAAKRLRLSAIAGCQFVFLLATPFGLQAAGNRVQYLNHMISSHRPGALFGLIFLDHVILIKHGLSSDLNFFFLLLVTTPDHVGLDVVPEKLCILFASFQNYIELMRILPTTLV